MEIEAKIGLVNMRRKWPVNMCGGCLGLFEKCQMNF